MKLTLSARLGAVALAVLAASACTTGGSTSGKTLGGATTQLSQSRRVALAESPFNVPAFFDRIDRVEIIERDNGRAALYEYYIGNEVAVEVDHVPLGWFNTATENHYKDADAARQKLRKRGIPDTVPLHPLPGQPRGGGFHAEAYGCTLFAFAKRVKPRTASSGDQGQPDTTVRGRICDAAPGAGATFYDAFGEMTAADQATIAARAAK